MLKTKGAAEADDAFRLLLQEKEKREQLEQSQTIGAAKRADELANASGGLPE